MFVYLNLLCCGFVHELWVGPGGAMRIVLKHNAYPCMHVAGTFLSRAAYCRMCGWGCAKSSKRITLGVKSRTRPTGRAWILNAVYSLDTSRHGVKGWLCLQSRQGLCTSLTKYPLDDGESISVMIKCSTDLRFTHIHHTDRRKVGLHQGQITTGASAKRLFYAREKHHEARERPFYAREQHHEARGEERLLSNALLFFLCRVQCTDE